MKQAPFNQQLQQAVDAHRKGNLDRAESIYLRLLSSAPDNPDLLHLLGLIAQQKGDVPRACELLRKAAEGNPTNALFLYDLAKAQLQAGDFQRAGVSAQKAAGIQPFPQAHFVAGEASRMKGDLSAAANHYQHALDLRPDYLEALNNLGATYRALKNDTGAISAFKKAVALQPHRTDLLHNLGLSLANAGAYQEAYDCFQNLLSIDPHHISAVINIGTQLMLQGFLPEAQQAFSRAIQLDPSNHNAQCNLLLCKAYDPAISSTRIRQDHIDWGARYNNTSSVTHCRVSPDPNRRLRLGFVSPDFYRHPVASFLENFLVHYDRKSFETIAFSDVARPDSITQRLIELFDHFVTITDLDDTQLAQRIADEHVDILFDLTGHLSANRLRAFARKPAPLQISWIGYPFDTGLEAIDYRISDRICDPETGGTDDRILRLPSSFCCFRPPRDAPEPGELPSDNTSTVTFGSFHNVVRLNPEVLRLWARILQKVQDARLFVFRSTLSDRGEQRIKSTMRGQGIDASRIVFRRKPTSGSYLAEYRYVDILLDTFPWSGHTTACESLWMGVPVITLMSDRPAGRMVASVLHTIGLQECIAATPEEYMEKALKLAATPTRLRELRSSLRNTLETSVLCNGNHFTTELSSALRECWRRVCSTDNP